MKMIKFFQILSYFSRIWFLWILSFIINIISFLYINYHILPSEKTFALHYNIQAGVDWFGNGYNLFLLPIIGLFLGIGNFILFQAQKKNIYFLNFLPSFVSLVVQMIILSAVLFLARVN